MSFFTKRYNPPGTAPGTVHIPDQAQLPATPLSIHIADYGAERIEEITATTARECKAYLDAPSITWVHVQGRLTSDTLHELGEIFELHPLALEDIVNTGQRPKFEIYDKQLFIVLSLPCLEDNGVATRQVSVFFSGNRIISFYEGDEVIFEPVYRRLRAAPGRFSHKGADYLLYAILDLVIDRGFPVLEVFDEQIEALEEMLLDRPDAGVLHRIHGIKRQLLMLRRMLWPQREVLNGLLRDEEAGFSDNTRLYLRDCYDHALQIIDLIETYRDMATNMIDIYLSSTSNRMSEVMRVLTIIATLFIPPTFIVGVYGMNFDPAAGPWNMPELAWPYGYAAVWGVILAMTVGLLIYFRRRRWF